LGADVEVTLRLLRLSFKRQWLREEREWFDWKSVATTFISNFALVPPASTVAMYGSPGNIGIDGRFGALVDNDELPR